MFSPLYHTLLLVLVNAIPERGVGSFFECLSIVLFVRESIFGWTGTTITGI